MCFMMRNVMVKITPKLKLHTNFISHHDGICDG